MADQIGNYDVVMKKEFPKAKLKEYEPMKEKIKRSLGISFLADIFMGSKISENALIRKFIRSISKY